MARAPSTVAPVILPEAFKQYSKEDEDRTRKMIEMVLRDLSASHNITNAIVQSGAVGGGPFPRSGIVGVVTTTGNASHPAFIQLLNPPSSGVNVVVYELSLSLIASSGTSHRIFGVVNASPTDLSAGTDTTATPIRLDENDVTAIVAVLQGTSNVGVAIAENAAEFTVAPPVEASNGWAPSYVRTPGSFPITLAPGSALEFATKENGVTSAMRMYAVWDENVI